MRLPSLRHAKTYALRAIASLTPAGGDYAGGDKVVGRRVGASQDRAMLQRHERDRGSQAGGLLDRGAGAGRCDHRLRFRYDAPPGAGGRFRGARRARDRQEGHGLRDADPDARPDRVIERFGGSGARAVRDRTPARRDSGDACRRHHRRRGHRRRTNRDNGRGCSSATARDRYSARPPRRRTADGVCGARRECASLREESVTSRNGVLHRRRI